MLRGCLTPLSPRKPSGLPYVQPNRVGRLSYVRRIPADLLPFAGNQKIIRRSLGLKTTNQADPVVIQAWTRAHEEAEALLNQAEAAKVAAAAQPQEITAPAPEVTPLTPRDRAGIAAEPWRKLLETIDQGPAAADDFKDLVEFRELMRQVVVELQASGDRELAHALATRLGQRLLAPVLASLNVRTDPTTDALLSTRLWGYVDDLRADVKARREGDYSTDRLKSKAPPLPQKQVSWAQVLEQYAISVGGTTEDDGIGVSKDRIAQYRLYIREICEVSGKAFPAELQVDHARQYVNHLQQGSLAIKTQQKRVDGLRNLYQIAIQYGLLDENPFGNMRIKVPRGSEENSYRSFTADELKAILQQVRKINKIDRCWVVEALLCTGARAAEIIKLRHSDIAQTEAGIWYLDFKHQPTDAYPTSLKGAQAGERKTPLHAALLASGYEPYLQRRSKGYVIEMSTDTSAWSLWFKGAVLIPLGLYERKRTGLHSLRNTAIDLWREAGLSGEVRKALVAHANTDVQDRIYGEGLKNMPDVLYKELSKVNLKNYIE